MHTPPFLHPGDTIAIAATARKVTPEDLLPSIALFESWGLKVITPYHLYDSQQQYAGDDETRTQVFQSQLDNPEVKAIICAKGGYGTVRIIDKLDFSGFEQSPKWVVGFSDVTVLHSHIHTLCNTATLHATMPLNIAPDAATISYPNTETLKKALFGEPLEYRIPGHSMNRRGSCQGQLVGGNLSIIYSLCGSRSSINTAGKVLFIEDLDEYLYHIDRMMMNLKRNGMLDNLAGLVVGQMSDMHDNAIPFGKTAEEIVLDAAKEYDYPVAFNFPSGHNGTNNHALILGQKVSLEVEDTTSLVWGE